MYANDMFRINGGLQKLYICTDLLATIVYIYLLKFCIGRWYRPDTETYFII